MKNWFLAARPKTLTAAFVPVVVASSLTSALSGHFSFDLALWALLASFLIQIATNLVNDALDFKKGTDNETRIGPMRVTATGLIHSSTVMRAAYFCFAMAFACGVPLVIAGGTPILVLGLCSILCGYLYTGGPYPLAYHGLGELFVIVFFGLLAVSGMFFLHSAQFSPDALVAGLQVGLLAAVLISVNNLRDIVGDKLSSKKTLAVRFGPRVARASLALYIFVPYLLGAYWFKSFPWATFLPLLTLPIALPLIREIYATEPSPKYNLFLARAALLHAVFGLLMSAGFLHP